MQELSEQKLLGKLTAYSGWIRRAIPWASLFLRHVGAADDDSVKAETAGGTLFG
jgi:hypothetical protein